MPADYRGISEQERTDSGGCAQMLAVLRTRRPRSSSPDIQGLPQGRRGEHAFTNGVQLGEEGLPEARLLGCAERSETLDEQLQQQLTPAVRHALTTEVALVFVSGHVHLLQLLPSGLAERAANQIDVELTAVCRQPPARLLCIKSD